jgi:hypothetical protein
MSSFGVFGSFGDSLGDIPAEEFNGYNSQIVEDLIKIADLTPEVTETPTNLVNTFKCINAIIFERISVLMNSIDFQLRYDPATRKVHYETRGFIDNSRTLTTGTEIVGLPEWIETTDGMINDLRIDGATTETNYTESGIIGTDEGWETSGIQLSKTPNIVELIIDGEQKIGGSKGALNTYFYVDRTLKRIYPQTGSFPTESAVVNYTWQAPIPLQRKRTTSINKYGLFQEVLSMPDIVNLEDAKTRLNKILEKRSEPFTIGKLKIRVSFDLKVGELVTIVDTLNNPNVNEQFVITKIKRIYPSGYDEIEVGNKEWKLEDDIVEMESRIKRLEERFSLEAETITQIADAQNTTPYIKHKHFIIRKGAYSTERSIGLYDNPSHGLYDEGKVYADDDEDAFDWGVYQDTS